MKGNDQNRYYQIPHLPDTEIKDGIMYLTAFSL